MPLNSHQPVYKATTTVSGGGNGDYYPVEGGLSTGDKGGYLARTLEPGCCNQSKRKLQCITLTGAIACLLGGGFLMILVVSSAGGSEGLVALTVLFALTLMSVGVGLLVFYQRREGRCNLPCWPSRAAVLSRDLNVANAFPEVPRSGTQVTLVDKPNVSSSGDERLKLMEDDNVAAVKIQQSKPKLVIDT